MNNQERSILSKNYTIEKKYTVVFFIKKSINAETYRVKTSDGKLFFLKLFNYSKLHPSSFDIDNNILEIELAKSINQQNIVSYIESGELIIENRKLGYLVLDFIAGETLYEKITREKIS